MTQPTSQIRRCLRLIQHQFSHLNTLAANQHLLLLAHKVQGILHFFLRAARQFRLLCQFSVAWAQVTHLMMSKNHSRSLCLIRVFLAVTTVYVEVHSVLAATIHLALSLWSDSLVLSMWSQVSCRHRTWTSISALQGVWARLIPYLSINPVDLSWVKWIFCAILLWFGSKAD